MADGYYNRDRWRDERGPVERAGDEVRSWFGDDEAARRRRMDEAERERWNAEERSRRPEYDRDRWRGSRWGDERSYGSGREYGDRDYGWRSEPPAARFTGTSYGPYEPPPTYSGYADFSRQGYGGPYGRERFGAREWSSTEGWRVPGPYTGRGPRGYQRSDQRIQEELHDRLTAHGMIDATDVECRINNGEVTLAGFVNSREAKRAAEDLAEGIYGVRQVNNQLRVRSHADDEGVGRTSVLGLTESQTQTRHSPADTTGPGRPRTRT